MGQADEQQIRSLQRTYTDFLDDETRDNIYNDKIETLIRNDDVRLIVNINELRSWNNERAQSLIQDSATEIVAFQRALRDLILIKDPKFGKLREEFYIGLEGSFGKNHVTPRTIHTRCLNQIICVEGIVTKCSLIRPKIVRSVHYCPTTGKTIERKYYDLTSLESQPSSGVYPTKDDDGNLLETEFGLSTYKDHQIVTLQELPEKAPPGQLPRSIEVSCDDDLIDLCKPGDRVHIVGLYKILPGKKAGVTSATFRTMLIANNVVELTKDSFSTSLISSSDVAAIKRFSEQRASDVFSILARSLAPTIHGMEYVKKAVLCMLLGGVEKMLPNGTRLRGDINVLLVGDPSVAKSQILRFVWKTAPRAISTTGRGSSGVGLTASVVANEDSGGGFDSRRLEAGACVLADRGIVCIDEFDKMTDADRTAIHEVMEQGRVTVAKAGIRATLNARCSVLAAANPVYSRYDQYKTPMENIGMQDSLLSRFDLTFVLLDQADTEQDSIISDHIVRIHQYRRPGEKEGAVLPLNLTTSSIFENGQFLSTFALMSQESNENNIENENDEDNTTDITHNTTLDFDSGENHLIGAGNLDSQYSLRNSNSMTLQSSQSQERRRSSGLAGIYEKFDRLLHGPDYKKHKILKGSFVKKYIQLARNIKPVLTDEASNYISDEYVKLRAQSSVMIDNMAKTQPITVRTLETLIRLSTAHAKARLSKNIELVDAQAALDLVQYAYFKNVIDKPKKKSKKDDNYDGTEIDSSFVGDEPPVVNSDESYHSMEEDNVIETETALENNDNNIAGINGDALQQQTTIKMPEERLKQFKRQLLKIFDASPNEYVEKIAVLQNINVDLTGGLKEFIDSEIEEALNIMIGANQIMIDAGKIFRVI